MKIKTLLSLLLASVMVLSMVGCSSKTNNTAQDQSSAATTGSEGSSSEVSEEPSSEASEEFDPMVDNIDLTFEEGNVKFDHVEKANAQLTDYSNALIFVFKYTNYQSKPAQCQSTFRFTFYQNGTELTDMVSYSSAGGSQYELVGAFFDTAMKNGSITFGQIVIPEDNSPITIMVERNGGFGDEEYQMMEVDISSASSASSSSSSASADEVEKALQGQWKLGADNTFTFDNGDIIIEGGGNRLEGTYTVNTSDSTIDASLKTTDGNVSIHLPYSYSNGTLTLKNNNNQQLIKQ